MALMQVHQRIRPLGVISWVLQGEVIELVGGTSCALGIKVAGLSILVTHASMVVDRWVAVQKATLAHPERVPFQAKELCISTMILCKGGVTRLTIGQVVVHHRRGTVQGLTGIDRARCWHRWRQRPIRSSNGFSTATILLYISSQARGK